MVALLSSLHWHCIVACKIYSICCEFASDSWHSTSRPGPKYCASNRTKAPERSRSFRCDRWSKWGSGKLTVTMSNYQVKMVIQRKCEGCGRERFGRMMVQRKMMEWRQLNTEFVEWNWIWRGTSKQSSIWRLLAFPLLARKILLKFSMFPRSGSTPSVSA